MGQITEKEDDDEGELTPHQGGQRPSVEYVKFPAETRKSDVVLPIVMINT